MVDPGPGEYPARSLNTKREGADMSKTKRTGEFGQMVWTRFPELCYQMQGVGNWRVLWTETSAPTGPQYPSEKALLSDLSRLAGVMGFGPPVETVQHWLDDVRDALTDIAFVFEQTAPTVSRWADDLFIRINENPDAVPLSEVLFVGTLREDGSFVHPNTAANLHYKLMSRLGRDTTGMAGF